MARPEIPAGYSGRGATTEDVAGAAQLLHLTAIAEGGVPIFAEDDLANWWGMHYISIADDVLVVTADGDDELVAVEVVSHGPPFIHGFSLGGVHPDHCGLGLGTAMLRWAIARAGERIELAPAHALVDFHCYVFADHEPSASLMAGAGLQHDRYFVDMEIEFDRRPEPPVYPTGVAVRNFLPGTDDVAAWRAMDAAFSDHYGYVPIEEEDGLARFRQRHEHPEFDAKLWWLAEADGEVIGGIWTEPSHVGDAGIGYIGNLGVVRPWRGRGLGRALLLQSLTQLYDLGKRGAALGTDASSLTGAARLYESVGMHVASRSASYALVLRDGVDLKTTSLD